MSKENRSQISAGILLIGLGILFLLNTLGLVRGFNWRLLLDFWPVIIILIGLNIIFKNTKLWWLTSLVLVFAILALFLVDGGTGYSRYEYTYRPYFAFRSPLETYNREMPYGSELEKMYVTLNLGAGRLIIGEVDANNVYEAKLQYADKVPELNYYYENRIAYFSIKEFERSRNRFNFSARNDWTINLKPQLPLSIQVNAGAGDFDLDLGSHLISNLTVNSGAGNLKLRLGEEADNIRINSAAGNIDIFVPEEKEVQIRTVGLIRQNNFSDQGLIKGADNTYHSKNFKSDENALEIEINSPVSKSSINFY
ncbi:LiaF transmembrane domain-containing protein [Natronospora cellulosivora (SeqCode)]